MKIKQNNNELVQQLEACCTKKDKRKIARMKVHGAKIKNLQKILAHKI